MQLLAILDIFMEDIDLSLSVFSLFVVKIVYVFIYSCRSLRFCEFFGLKEERKVLIELKATLFVYFLRIFFIVPPSNDKEF